ncbi:MAG: radical SAM protein [Candidatus Edwardsbacteria bacterium]|nr:radical SAM protein [Candidatus Edwardsbacteria bacterium]
MRSPIDIIKNSPPLNAVRRKLQTRRVEALRQLALDGGKIPLPRGLVFEPTQRCNLSCIMCCHRQHHTEGSCQEMDTGAAVEFIKGLKRQHGFRIIGFIGSEPFVRADLEDLMKAAVGLGLDVSVQTNSTLLDEARIKTWSRHRCRIRSFGASLEGVAGVDDRIRPGKDVFNRARRGIELAVQAGLPVTVSILILDSNREKLGELIELLNDLEVRSMDLSLIVNHSRTDIEETVRLSGMDEKDVCITSKPELEYRTPADVLLDDLKKGLARGRSFGMRTSTSPEGFLANYPSIRDGSIRKKRRLTCGAMDTVRVDPSGRLIHCQHFRQSFGDLRQVKLAEAWNSPGFRNFRKRLAEENLFPICVDCYRMRVLG